VVEDSVAEISELKERGFGGAGVFFELRGEEVEEGFGENEGRGRVAARVVVDGGLAPGIEAVRIEGVGVGEEDLGSRDDNSDGLRVRAAGRMNRPDGDSVIGIGPKEADGFDAGASDEEGEERGEFVAFSGGGLVGEGGSRHGLPLLPDSVRVGRLIGDAPMQVPVASVACGFEEKMDERVIGEVEGAGIEVMRGEEGLVVAANSRGGFGRLGFGADGGEEISEGGGLRGLSLENGDRRKEQDDKKQQAETRNHTRAWGLRTPEA